MNFKSTYDMHATSISLPLAMRSSLHSRSKDKQTQPKIDLWVSLSWDNPRYLFWLESLGIPSRKGSARSMLY